MSNDAKPRVVMVGLGYIGLPTAAVLARAGAQVFGVDVSSRVVNTINRGDIHIEEADLGEAVRDAVTSGRLQAGTEPRAGDVFLIAVPTPFDSDHAPDVSMVMDAARAIAPVLEKGNIVILESTSPVGTTEALRDVLAEARPDLAFPRDGEPGDVAVAYCPERVLPGKILHELVANDRVIGGITPDCTERARALYALFVEGERIGTDARAAEMTKLTENAFRDVNIAFANELSIIADRLEMDVWEVIRLANRHPRVNILQPGPGVGGHCIAVDPWFIVHSAPEQSPLIRTAREVNDGKVDHTIARSANLVESVDGPVALLGLAFKPDIDDFRESPALKVASALADRFGDRIVIVEPHMDGLPQDLADTGARATTLDDALVSCAGLVLLVDHAPFRALKGDDLAGKAIYDTRGAWRQETGS